MGSLDPMRAVNYLETQAVWVHSVVSGLVIDREHWKAIADMVAADDLFERMEECLSKQHAGLRRKTQFFCCSHDPDPEHDEKGDMIYRVACRSFSLREHRSTPFSHAMTSLGAANFFCEADTYSRLVDGGAAVGDASYLRGMSRSRSRNGEICWRLKSDENVLEFAVVGHRRRGAEVPTDKLWG